MDRLALALLTALLAVGFQRSSVPSSLSQEIAVSTDVRWLERLCADLSFAESEYAARGRRIAGVKGNRSAAYLRLGALGTRQSLDAIGRIEKSAFERPVLPGPGTPRRPAYHPAPHMSDGVLAPSAQLRLADGREAAAYQLLWYGSPMIYLSLRSDAGWSAPALIPFALSPYLGTNIAMTEVSPGRLRFSLSAQRPDPNRPVDLVPDVFEARLADVVRDTDGDGWTDLAERHLGLDWTQADSDRDGIPDGRDGAPLLGVGTITIGEDEQILQRAVFAIFGLTGSPGALHVADNSRRFHPFGLPGPLFYADVPGAVRVNWKILEKTAEAATVEIVDYEGPLAASGNHVVLKKIDGAWYAVSIKMQWIS